MDLHAKLYAIKFLLSLWRASPIQHFPANQAIAREFDGISARFLESANLCLDKTSLSQSWRVRAREFLADDLLSADSTSYDEKALNLWLMLYGGYEEEKRFSFGDSEDFIQQTKGMFRDLVWDVLADLKPASETGENPLFTMLQAFLIWEELAPQKSFKINGSELFKDIVKEKVESNFECQNLTRANIAEFWDG